MQGLGSLDCCPGCYPSVPFRRNGGLLSRELGTRDREADASLCGGLFGRLQDSIARRPPAPPLASAKLAVVSFFPTQQAPLAPLWLLWLNPRSQGVQGAKLITVPIDFPFSSPPLSLCWGALSHRRRLCSRLQRRWGFTQIERTKNCDKLQ